MADVVVFVCNGLNPVKPLNPENTLDDVVSDEVVLVVRLNGLAPDDSPENGDIVEAVALRVESLTRLLAISFFLDCMFAICSGFKGSAS